MYRILKQGERSRLNIDPLFLKDIGAIGAADKFRQSVSVDNGNAVAIEAEETKDGNLAFDVVGREHGFASVTVIISDAKSGEVIAVAGQQYFVPRDEKEVKVTQLGVVEVAKAAAAQTDEQKKATATDQAKTEKK